MEKTVYTTLDAVPTGRKIKKVLTEKGYSVRKIQMMLNLSCPQPIYRWIKGKAMPSIDNLYMLHRILGMQSICGAGCGSRLGDNTYSRINYGFL